MNKASSPWGQLWTEYMVEHNALSAAASIYEKFYSEYSTWTYIISFEFYMDLWGLEVSNDYIHFSLEKQV